MVENKENPIFINLFSNKKEYFLKKKNRSHIIQQIITMILTSNA